MPDKIEDATTALQEFAKSRNIDALERAVDALEEFDIWSIKPDQRLPARGRVVLTWCRVFRALDAVEDPGYDPNSSASRYPPPPAGYPSGVKPESVRDPRARARYEAAIAENEKKRANRKTQMLARALDDRAVRAVHKIIPRLYTSSAADRKELHAIFDESGLSEARRKQMGF